MVNRLREYIRELQERLVEREAEISRYQGRLRKARSARDERLKKEQDITTRDSIIQGLKRKLRHVERSNEKLRKRLDQVRQIDSILESGDSAPVKVLESLTREGVRTLADSIGIRPGDLLFVRRIGGWGRGAVKELLESRIQAVIAGEPANMIDPELDRAFFEMELPLLIAEEMGGILIRGRYGIVDRERLSDAMNKRAQGLEAFRRKEEAGRIETLLAIYQVERGKEMKKVG
jgi:predicted RNase H-like nuclease (RuvC/YqgF family)